MTRLSLASLHRARAMRPAYDPAAIATGIVHFGAGAFHRAHQAAFVDALLVRDPRWGIVAVSLRSAGATDALAAQDGLYTLAIRGVESADRILAPHRRWIGPAALSQVVPLFDDPGIAVITATVTEKGYCLGAGGAPDPAHPDLQHDHDPARMPRSLFGWIVAAMARRRAAGLPGLTVLSCDNLARNGAVMRGGVLTLARERDPSLADWIAAESRFPGTMVDSITPATDPAFLASVAHRIALDDRAAVRREAFAQWVIEDMPGASLPDLASVGATLTRDVAGWEAAKLRILNAAHSALAYSGLLAGHRTVADAIADPVLTAHVERMVRNEILPHLASPDGADLGHYAQRVFQRLGNPQIAHRLEQIAADGSQKLPQRIMPSLVERWGAGLPSEELVRALAGWIAFCIRATRSGATLADPLAARIVSATGAGDVGDCVRAMVGIEAIFPAALRDSRTFVTAMSDTTAQLVR